MKKAVVIISVVVALLVCMLCFSGCGGGSDSNNKKVTTPLEAVQAVTSYMDGTLLKQKIALALDFKTYYNPEYGTKSATQNSDGSWNVSIKGNMTGSIDDYKNDYKTYKFEVSATVSETGSVQKIRAKKVQ